MLQWTSLLLCFAVFLSCGGPPVVTGKVEESAFPKAYWIIRALVIFPREIADANVASLQGGQEIVYDALVSELAPNVTNIELARAEYSGSECFESTNEFPGSVNDILAYWEANQARLSDRLPVLKTLLLSVTHPEKTSWKQSQLAPGGNPVVNVVILLTDAETNPAGDGATVPEDADTLCQKTVDPSPKQVAAAFAKRNVSLIIVAAPSVANAWSAVAADMAAINTTVIPWGTTKDTWKQAAAALIEQLNNLIASRSQSFERAIDEGWRGKGSTDGLEAGAEASEADSSAAATFRTSWSSSAVLATCVAMLSIAGFCYF